MKKKKSLKGASNTKIDRVFSDSPWYFWRSTKIFSDIRVYCSAKSTGELIGDEHAQRLTTQKLDDEMEGVLRTTTDLISAFFVPFPMNPSVHFPSFEMKMEWPPVRCNWRTDKLMLQVIFEHREEIQLIGGKEKNNHMFELKQLDFEYFPKEKDEAFQLLGKPIPPGGWHLEGLRWSLKIALGILEGLWYHFKGKVNLETEKMLASCLNTVRLYAYYRLCYHRCGLCGDLFEFSAKKTTKRKMCILCPTCQLSYYDNHWDPVSLIPQ